MEVLRECSNSVYGGTGIRVDPETLFRYHFRRAGRRSETSLRAAHTAAADPKVHKNR